MAYWKDGNTTKICMNPPNYIFVVLFISNGTKVITFLMEQC